MPGFYLEEFEIGQVFKHQNRRTLTEMDNMMFSMLTMNHQPLHCDYEFCETQTEFGKPLVNSLFTLGLMIGIAVGDTTIGTTIANLGMSEVKFPNPIFHGDTVRVETEIMATRESKSRPTAGIVDFEHRMYKQSGELVAICRRQAFILKRPEA